MELSSEHFPMQKLCHLKDVRLMSSNLPYLFLVGRLLLGAVRSAMEYLVTVA